MLLAILPSDIYLTRNWVGYLDVVRATVRSHQGVIAFEDSPLPGTLTTFWSKPGSCPARAWRCARKRGDGIIAPPKDFNALATVPAVGAVPSRPVRLARLGVRAMPQVAAYRGVVLLLWALAA